MFNSDETLNRTSLSPDILARIYLYTEEKGGRMSPWPKIKHGCVLMLENEAFDCTFTADDAYIHLQPGSTSILAVKFLFSDSVKPRLRPGTQFKLWDGKEIGEGEVLAVY
ncbi:hypothetical protein [Gloeobacter violaceus]|uniref:hypothetical protein n=1 Tax=Gloeobacter violaceus TaxID=33072 RepID=UPI0013E8EC61|nr:hypothetical protein [Gloeobacter violaceus]